MSTPTAKRQALRDFYKIQSTQEQHKDEPEHKSTENGALAPSEADSTDALEEDGLAGRLPIDELGIDINQWAAETVRTNGVVELMNVHTRLAREQAALASAQRELVNDNYKKLIQAAETLQYLSAQGALSGVDALDSSVQLVAEMVAAEPSPEPADSTARHRFEELHTAFNQKYGEHVQ